MPVMLDHERAVRVVENAEQGVLPFRKIQREFRLGKRIPHLLPCARINAHRYGEGSRFRNGKAEGFPGKKRCTVRVLHGFVRSAAFLAD